MTIRLATSQDGARIAALLSAGGFSVDGLDWSAVHPYWLVADEGGEVVGCLQVMAGRPVGWLELLAVDRGLPHKAQARAVKGLVERGLALLAGSGAGAAMGSVPEELEGCMAVLARRGGVPQGKGVLFTKRLA